MILYKKDPETIETVAQLLRDGGTCILPCDTIYGLSSLMGIGEKALKELKGRDASKPFLVLATLEQAKELCPCIPEALLEAWPAPLTAVLNTKDGGTIGIRVPDDEFLQKLLNKTKSPIYSTSVNLSGEPSLLNLGDICNRFEALVDVVVKDSDFQGKIASTLIDMSQKPYKIIRQGSYKADSLLNS